MKMSDINENISEAPDFRGGAKKLAQKVGRGAKELGKKAAAAGKLELQRNTPFNKNKRDIADERTRVKQEAKKVRKEFQFWMSQTENEGVVPTGEMFVQFITNEKPDLAPFVKEVGQVFGFTAAPEKEKSTGSTADNDTQQVDTTDGEETKDMTGMTQSDAEGFRKQAAEAEQEAKDLDSENPKHDRQDVKASKGDNEKPKTNTSASIYEARLAVMLAERELKGDDIDTFVVRLLQAKKKGSPTTAEVGTIAEPEQEQEKPKSRKERRAEKKQDATAQAEPMGDTQKEGNSDDAIVPAAWKQDLFNFLEKIYKGGELDDNDKKLAKKLYDQIN